MEVTRVVSKFLCLGTQTVLQTKDPVLDVPVYVPSHGVRNAFITLAIGTDSHLHIPMYFFLGNPFFTGPFFVTNTILNIW